MANLLQETIEILKEYNKSENDVLWVGRCEDWSSGYPDVKNTWGGLSQKLISSMTMAMVGKKFRFRL